MGISEKGSIRSTSSKNAVSVTVPDYERKYGEGEDTGVGLYPSETGSTSSIHTESQLSARPTGTDEMFRSIQRQLSQLPEDALPSPRSDEDGDESDDEDEDDEEGEEEGDEKTKETSDEKKQPSITPGTQSKRLHASKTIAAIKAAEHNVFARQDTVDSSAVVPSTGTVTNIREGDLIKALHPYTKQFLRAVVLKLPPRKWKRNQKPKLILRWNRYFSDEPLGICRVSAKVCFPALRPINTHLTFIQTVGTSVPTYHIYERIECRPKNSQLWKRGIIGDEDQFNFLVLFIGEDWSDPSQPMYDIVQSLNALKEIGDPIHNKDKFNRTPTFFNLFKRTKNDVQSTKITEEHITYLAQLIKDRQRADPGYKPSSSLFAPKQSSTQQAPEMTPSHNVGQSHTQDDDNIYITPEDRHGRHDANLLYRTKPTELDETCMIDDGDSDSAASDDEDLSEDMVEARARRAAEREAARNAFLHGKTSSSLFSKSRASLFSNPLQQQQLNLPLPPYEWVKKTSSRIRRHPDALMVNQPYTMDYEKMVNGMMEDKQRKKKHDDDLWDTFKKDHWLRIMYPEGKKAYVPSIITFKDEKKMYVKLIEPKRGPMSAVQVQKELEQEQGKEQNTSPHMLPSVRMMLIRRDNLASNATSIEYYWDPKKRDIFDRMWTYTMMLASMGGGVRKSINFMNDSGGHSLFRALSDQLFGTPDNYLFIRQQCVQHIANHADYYCNFVDTNFEYYLATKRRGAEPNSEYMSLGDHLDIQAICEIYDVRVEIFSLLAAGKPKPAAMFYCKLRHDDQLLPVIRLSYAGDDHYDSIVQMGVKLPLEVTPGSGSLVSQRAYLCHQVLDARRYEQQLQSKAREQNLTPEALWDNDYQVSGWLDKQYAMTQYMGPVELALNDEHAHKILRDILNRAGMKHVTIPHHYSFNQTTTHTFYDSGGSILTDNALIQNITQVGNKATSQAHREFNKLIHEDDDNIQPENTNISSTTPRVMIMYPYYPDESSPLDRDKSLPKEKNKWRKSNREESSHSSGSRTSSRSKRTPVMLISGFEDAVEEIVSYVNRTATYSGLNRRMAGSTLITE